MSPAQRASKHPVAVVFSYPLFGRGIARLLQSSDPEIDVRCISANRPDLQEQLSSLRPDVIIMESVSDGDVVRELIRDLPPFLYVGVRLKDDLMDVYADRQLLVARPEELVEVVHLGLKRRARPLLATH